jgi:hypothetical protein
VGAGSNKGSFAFVPLGDAGAVKIAARYALAGSAGVEVWSALARWPISSSKANARRVDLSFMRVSFLGRFMDEPRRLRRILKKKVRPPHRGADVEVIYIHSK